MKLGRTLVASFLLWASSAQAEWLEASSDHFIIYSEQKEPELREFATKLERFDKAMRVLRNVPDQRIGNADRLTVYVVRDLATVRKLFGEGASKGSYSVAGFYMPRATGSVAITPRRTGPQSKFDLDAEIVLLHEYAHHFMVRNFSGAFPAWFIEGFAEFHSTARFEKDGGVGIGTPALHRARALVFGQPIPIQRLMTHSTWDLSSEQREALYGRGWLLTHFLTFEPSRAGQFDDYIRRLNQGEASLPAATASFGDLKKLDRELDQYLKQRKLRYLPLAADKVAVGPVQIRRLSPGENAVMNLKIRSRRGVTAKRAKALVPEVRAAAAPFAADVRVQATLAEAEFDAGNYVEAEAAADRALAVDPKALDALIYKARARMELAAADESANEATWKEVRKSIIAANRVDPDDPEPLILFYRSYRAQGIEPTANATMGLGRALELAPQDGNLRMMTAYQYLIDGKAKEARSTLVPIAFDPHGGTTSKAAAAIVTALDAGDSTEKALAAWNTPSKADPEEESD